MKKGYKENGAIISIFNVFAKPQNVRSTSFFTGYQVGMCDRFLRPFLCFKNKF